MNPRTTPNPSPNPLRPEDINLLGQVGFLASSRGDLASASTIFEALERCRPYASFAYIGQAIALVNRGRHDDAIRVLDRGLTMVNADDSAEMHAFRALALGLAGRARECDRAIEAAGEHPMAVELAANPPYRK